MEHIDDGYNNWAQCEVEIAFNIVYKTSLAEESSSFLETSQSGSAKNGRCKAGQAMVALNWNSKEYPLLVSLQVIMDIFSRNMKSKGSKFYLFLGEIIHLKKLHFIYIKIMNV